MSEESVELRAERLRLFVAAIGEEPTMRAYEGADYGMVPGGWSYYMEDAEPVDYPDEHDLAWSCAELAQEVRARQWDALERFCVLHFAGEEQAAAVAAYDLGWFHKLPREG